MFRQDIKGSMAHAAMLAAKGIISAEDGVAITTELAKIRQEIASGELLIDPNAEDIHTFVEGELTKRIGDSGKRLHTARSRNDQVALDIRLYLIDEGKEIEGYLKNLLKVLVKLADSHTETIMPGYTHLQRAQPITFAHHILTYAFMLKRDFERIGDHANNIAKAREKVFI